MIIIKNKNLSFTNRLVIKTGFWFSILLNVALIIIIANKTLLNHWYIWIIALALLINDLRKSIIISKDYITIIDLIDNNVTIYYRHFDKELTKQISINDLSVNVDSKQLSMDKFLTTRLNFKVNNQLILCQYKIGDWTEDKMRLIEGLIIDKQIIND